MDSISISFDNVKGGIKIKPTETMLNHKFCLVINSLNDEFSLIKHEMQKVAEQAMNDGVELFFPLYDDCYDGVNLVVRENNHYLILPHNNPKSWFRDKAFRPPSHNKDTFITITYKDKKMNFNIYHQNKVSKLFDKLNIDQFIHPLDYYRDSDISEHDIKILSIESIDNEQSKIKYERSNMLGMSFEIYLPSILLDNIPFKTNVNLIIHQRTKFVLAINLLEKG